MGGGKTARGRECHVTSPVQVGMKLVCGLADYAAAAAAEEWSPDLRSGVGGAVPMPTLYAAADGARKPKLSIVELVLYNMAAMLAGVAAGYDVRLSNVSPLHPRLQPHTR